MGRLRSVSADSLVKGRKPLGCTARDSVLVNLEVCMVFEATRMISAAGFGLDSVWSILSLGLRHARFCHRRTETREAIQPIETHWLTSITPQSVKHYGLPQRNHRLRLSSQRVFNQGVISDRVNIKCESRTGTCGLEDLVATVRFRDVRCCVIGKLERGASRLNCPRIFSVLIHGNRQLHGRLTLYLLATRWAEGSARSKDASLTMNLVTQGAHLCTMVRQE